MTWPRPPRQCRLEGQPLKVVESQKRIVATEHSNEGSLRLSEQRRCHLEIVLQAPPAADGSRLGGTMRDGRGGRTTGTSRSRRRRATRQVLDGAGVFDRGRRVGHDHSGGDALDRPADAGQPIGVGIRTRDCDVPAHRHPRSPLEQPPQGRFEPPCSKRSHWRVQVVADRQVEGRRTSTALPVRSGRSSRLRNCNRRPRGDPCSESYGRGTCGRHWTAGGDPPQRARPPLGETESWMSR